MSVHTIACANCFQRIPLKEVNVKNGEDVCARLRQHAPGVIYLATRIVGANGADKGEALKIEGGCTAFKKHPWGRFRRAKLDFAPLRDLCG